MQTKAERICTFPRFVEWPAKRFSESGTPFVIGVFGMKEMADHLREIMQSRTIKDHPVAIRQLMSKEELPGCHMVFISRSERDRLDPILRETRREGILTVGESDNFLSRGGVINLVNIGGTIRFQISQEAARREWLVISSKLLQLALPPEVGAGRGGPRAN